MTAKAKTNPIFEAIWQSTSKPNRYTIAGVRHILVNRDGRNLVLSFDEMREDEIVRLTPKVAA